MSLILSPAPYTLGLTSNSTFLQFGQPPSRTAHSVQLSPERVVTAEQAQKLVLKAQEVQEPKGPDVVQHLRSKSRVSVAVQPHLACSQI